MFIRWGQATERGLDILQEALPRDSTVSPTSGCPLRGGLGPRTGAGQGGQCTVDPTHAGAPGRAAGAPGWGGNMPASRDLWDPCPAWCLSFPTVHSACCGLSPPRCSCSSPFSFSFVFGSVPAYAGPRSPGSGQAPEQSPLSSPALQGFHLETRSGLCQTLLTDVTSSPQESAEAVETVACWQEEGAARRPQDQAPGHRPPPRLLRQGRSSITGPTPGPAVRDIIIYEAHSFIHQLPTQGKTYGAVGMDLS